MISFLIRICLAIFIVIKINNESGIYTATFATLTYLALEFNAILIAVIFQVIYDEKYRSYINPETPFISVWRLISYQEEIENDKTNS